jgi:hypothetical protein
VSILKVFFTRGGQNRLQGQERGFAAYAAARCRIKVAMKICDTDRNIRRQLDSNGILPKTPHLGTRRKGSIYLSIGLSVLSRFGEGTDRIRNLLNVVRIVDHSFCH